MLFFNGTELQIIIKYLLFIHRLDSTIYDIIYIIYVILKSLDI